MHFVCTWNAQAVSCMMPSLLTDNSRHHSPNCTFFKECLIVLTNLDGRMGQHHFSLKHLAPPHPSRGPWLHGHGATSTRLWRWGWPRQWASASTTPSSPAVVVTTCQIDTRYGLQSKRDQTSVVAPSHLVEPTSSILIIYQARHCDIFVRSFSFFQDFGLPMTWLLPLARWWWVEEACTLSIYCADHAHFIQTVAQSSDNDSGMKTLI